MIYTAFNKASQITEGNYEYNIEYAADDERFKTELINTANNNTTIQTKYYAGDYEEIYDANNNVRKLHYIHTPYGIAAVVEKTGATYDIRYVMTDYLGSITAVTDEAGNILQQTSFDAWGRRRNPQTWAIYNPNAQVTIAPMALYFSRGYTGHEHLEQFELINMNGRMYDPALCRMLSVDNYNNDPSSTLGMNRYAYALNNPLKYTDPDGEWVNFVIGAVVGGVSGWQIGQAHGATGWGMVGYIAAGAVIGAASSGVASGISAAGGGAVAAGVAGGAVAGAGFNGLSTNWNSNAMLRGAAYGGISGGIGGGIGAAIGGGGGAFAGGAVGSGINTALNGGDWEEVGISALAGGSMAFGIYHASSYLSWQFEGGNKWGDVDISYRQYTAMQADFQRSRFWGREYGGYLLEGGGVKGGIVGNSYDIDLGAVPNGAFAEYHTHWDRPGVDIVQDVKGGPWMHKSDFQSLHAGETGIAVKGSQTYRYHSPLDINHGMKSIVINRYDGSYYPGTGGMSNIQPITPPINRFVYSFYFWR